MHTSTLSYLLVTFILYTQIKADTQPVYLPSNTKLNFISSARLSRESGADRAPSIQVIFPENGKEIEGVVNIRINATPSLLTTVTAAVFYRKSVPETIYSLTRTNVGNEWAGTWNVSTLDNGPDTLVFRVTDNISATTTQEIYITIASGSVIAPWVRITDPVPGDTLSGNRVITFLKNPGSGVKISELTMFVDGDSVELDTSVTLFSITTNDYPDGAHTFQMQVINDAGMLGISPVVTYHFQNTPTVTLYSPSAGQKISGMFTIEYRAAAIFPAELTMCKVFIDGGLLDFASTDTTFLWNTTPLPDGSHTLQLKVTDDKGKTGQSELISISTANSPEVTLLTPTAGAELSGTVTVRFSDSASFPSVITKRQIYIDGGLVDTSALDKTYIWNTTTLTDGQHTIQVKVIDDKNKTGLSDFVVVSLYNTPVVNIYAPLSSKIITAIDTIKFTTDYPDATIRDTTEICFDGGTWLPTTTDYTYTWVSADYFDGSHTVQIRARGSNGKTGYSQIRSYLVNNAPVVTITAPSPGEALKGIYTVTFSTTPANGAVMFKKEASIDGSGWTDSGLVDSVSYAMNTTEWTDGSHSIQIRSIDNKGRIGFSNPRLFVVDNTPPLLSKPVVEYPGGAGATKSDTTVLVTVFAEDILSGLTSDSAVFVTTYSKLPDTAITYAMNDKGKYGDKVAHDKIYSVPVTVTGDTADTIGYSITAKDKLGNTVTITSAISLDNIPAVVSALTWIPAPQPLNMGGRASYFNKLVVHGSYSDAGGSGLARAFISILNDSGDHVNDSPIELAAKDTSYSRIIRLVEGRNFISLAVKDCAGNKSVRRDTITYIEPKVSSVIGKEGGTVNCQDGAGIVIPPNALLKTHEISITRAATSTLPLPLNPNMRMLGAAHNFAPDRLTFRKPVKLTVPYTDADMDIDQDGTNNFNPAHLIIVFWDGLNWINAGISIVDTTNKTVSVNVNHFTTFDIAEIAETVPKTLIYFWSHNPVKSDVGSHFTFEIPEGGTVSLTIHDLAGDLVYQLIAPKTSVTAGSHSIGWYGQNVSEQFAGAGIYAYVFSYTRNSNSKKTVIRKAIGLLK